MNSSPCPPGLAVLLSNFILARLYHTGTMRYFVVAVTLASVNSLWTVVMICIVALEMCSPAIGSTTEITIRT